MNLKNNMMYNLINKVGGAKNTVPPLESEVQDSISAFPLASFVT
jgi:hypothetical protein